MRPSTARGARSTAVGEDHQEFRVRLGTGVIALQQAMNNVVERYHWFILGLVNLAGDGDRGLRLPLARRRR